MKREFKEFARIFVNNWLIESDNHASVDEDGRKLLQDSMEQALILSHKIGMEDQKFYGPGGFWRRVKRLATGK